ncbi:tripartite-type tricarboxylate transporter receptor subunit TctC [Nitrobacteraceae bacterium AZCC 2146]
MRSRSPRPVIPTSVSHSLVPYAAGGATDVSARLLASKLSDAWKQAVVVENKSGAGGLIGNDFVAKAPADGYTVLVAITQIIQAPSLVSNLSYDVFKDLAPVIHVALSPIVLTIPDAQPMKSLKDLIDLAKANPGKYAYGTFGNATTSHLYGELLKKTAGIDLTHVPYRGSAPLLNDLLGNQVTAAFVDLTTAGPQLSGGKVRALAVGGETRKKLLPDCRPLPSWAIPASRPKAGSASSYRRRRPRTSSPSCLPNWRGSSRRPRGSRDCRRSI